MGGTAFRTGSSLCPQERDLLAVEEIVHIHVASPSTCQGYGKMRLFSHCPRVEFRSKSAQCDSYTIFLSGCGPIFGQNHARQIGRAHVCTPVTNAPLVCRLVLEK